MSTCIIWIDPVFYSTYIIWIEPALDSTYIIWIEPALDSTYIIWIEPALDSTYIIWIEPALDSTYIIWIEPVFDSTYIIWIEPVFDELWKLSFVRVFVFLTQSPHVVCYMLAKYMVAVHLRVVFSALPIVTWESLGGVWNIQPAIYCTLHCSEHTSTCQNMHNVRQKKTCVCLLSHAEKNLGRSVGNNFFLILFFIT